MEFYNINFPLIVKLLYIRYNGIITRQNWRVYMLLKQLKLKNFRGYKDFTVDFDDSMNVIIGKNDIGKSTILEALDIFFNLNEAQSKIDVSDLNVNCTEAYIEISSIFDEVDSIRNLESEYLLNKNKHLEIKRVWECSDKKLSRTSKTYLRANSPVIEGIDKPLITINTLSRQNIEKILKACTTPEDSNILSGYLGNPSTNRINRMAIFGYFKDKSDFEEVDIEIKSTNDTKDIWIEIERNLPTYYLFKSDRTNLDNDVEVQNPLKIATKNVLNEISSELEIIKKKVEDAVKDVGKNTINKLKEMDENIANNLETVSTTKQWDSIFSFEIRDDQGIPLNKRGSGVRRLMLFSYFRAEVDRIAKENKKNNIIYAIEEPETSQHPNYQKMIIDDLLTLSNSHQIILTTHTPEIAKMIDIDQLIFIDKDKENNSYVVKDEVEKVDGVISSLGLLPDIFNKLLICVEGPYDIGFLKNVSKLDSIKKLIDIENKNISFIPMQGSNLVSWIAQNYLDKTSVKEFHIYDGDRDDYMDKVRKMNEKGDVRRRGVNLKRREMENYIPPCLIEKEFNITIPNKCKENWHNENIPILIYNNENVKSKYNDVGCIKSILNGKLSKQITESHLKSMLVFEEVYSWFEEIKKMYEEKEFSYA
jgi:putative ATP-dependent endonuclease of OLD family